MKKSIIILYASVILTLVIGIPLMVVVGLNPTELTASYITTSKENVNGTTTLVLTVNLTYTKGLFDTTIDYSQFNLKLYATRALSYIYEGAVNPENNGKVTIGSSHPTQTFQLNFQYDTLTFNGMDNAPQEYQLSDNGATTIQWTDTSLHY
jgi:hypothetical protein